MSLPPEPGSHAEHYDTQQIGNVAAAVRDLRHPKQIGPYSIQAVIGEGGMGTVYQAHQREPIQRTVAIKIIKLGMDTREVIARFDAERQALALMNHTNVAKVLDAGATEAGRPYFVMEFFKGEPITHYADRHKLTVRERLELFMQACDAVQHAHHKAIIHRDLKPSNILVTEEGGKAVVKVIDFGVAKALGGQLTEKTLFTTTGQLVGTPEYMAPEQADAIAPDVDTRTDVYSLGVVLYELLSGTLPFDPDTLRSAGYNEIQRIIREVDPPRPHTRLSSLGASAVEVARRRSVELDTLTRQLKSELEWIPLKAMRKERGQRYASPTELAEDLQNYLNSRPLRAGPESAGYRARKFLRRNKRGVAASLAMLLLLIAGIITTTWQAIRANREKREAQLASENLAEVNRFLTEDLLVAAAPEFGLGKDMTVREAVDRAADTVSARFANRPEIEATVRVVLADTYDAMGYTERALPHAQASFDLYRRTRGADDELTLDAGAELAHILVTLNRIDDAERQLNDTIARATRVLGAEHRVTLACLSTFAQVLRLQGRLDQAEQVHRQVLDGHTKLFGAESKQAAQSMSNFAVLKTEQRQLDEAERLHVEALSVRRRILPTDHPATLLSQSNLARLYEEQGRLTEAEKLYREVLAAKRRVLKDDHPGTTLTMMTLAVVLSDLERYTEAEALSREALERRTRMHGPDDVNTLLAANNLAAILNRQQKSAEAEMLLRDVVERRRRVLGETHVYTVHSTFGLLRALVQQKKDAETDEWLDTLQRPELFEKLYPEQKALVLYQRGVRGMQTGRVADAEPPLRDALELLTKAEPFDAAAVARVQGRLAEVYEQTGRADEAAKLRADAAATSAPSTKPSTPKPN